MLQEYSIIAIIPAFNAAKTISLVIKNLQRASIQEIVVIDDGSVDSTFDICQKLNVHTIRHDKNLGKGMALRTGFQYAISQDIDFVLTLDADNQHKPSDSIRLLEHLTSNRCDMVIGNRMLNVQHMPFHRILSNRITSKILSWVTKIKIEDSQCGYRLFKTEILRHLTLTTCHFDLESEIIIKTAKLDFKICFTPIQTIYSKSATSFVKAFDVIRFVRLIIKSAFIKGKYHG